MTAVHRRLSDHLRTLQLVDKDGREQEIRTTDEHPFHAEGQRWTAAGRLRIGQWVSGPDGSASRLLASGRQEHPEGIEVFNLSVEQSHTYFVAGEGAEASAVWVHNTCFEVPNGGRGRGLADGNNRFVNAGPAFTPLFSQVPLPQSYARGNLSVKEIADRLPTYSDGDPAHGALLVGNRAYLLRSNGPGGRPQYSTNLAPKGAVEADLGFTPENVGHLESQGAALLRALGSRGVDVSRATMVMNRPFSCFQRGQGCAPNLRQMLPGETTLQLYGAGPVKGGGNFLRYYRQF